MIEDEMGECYIGINAGVENSACRQMWIMCSCDVS
jgi:hypothetical protein